MSDKIYFNTSNKFSFKRSLVSVSTRLHHAVAPKHAENLARKLLLTPVRSKPKNAQPQGLIKRELKTSEGTLQTYQLGEGPVWVLTHGWSGTANQFMPLMEHIASQGYTALAYDHPAHGESEGVYGHIPGFVRGLEAVLDNCGDVAGIIGHSMGTAAALECHHQKLLNCPMLLIAPVLDYLDNLFSSLKRSGYSMKLFNAVALELEKEYHYPLHSIDPYTKLCNRTSRTFIVHDQDDKFARFAVSQKAANEIDNVTLIATQGQGHGRIMKSDFVMQAFNVLAQE
ncbi:lysophospholipase [Vibrio sp. AK197]